MKKYIIISLSLSLILIAFITIAVKYKPRYKKPFTILISREPDNLSFLFSRQGVSLYLQKAIFRGLIETNDKLNPYPELAENIPTIKNKQVIIKQNGKMIVHWKLKQNLKWADGTKLTTDDVVFTYKLLQNPKIISFAKEKTNAKYIENIIKNDKYNFTVVWKMPYYEYLYAHPILPKHILEKYLDKPEHFSKINFHRMPIGNGPYKIKEWKAGSYILMQKNKHYHKKVNIDKIAFKIVKDVNSLLINLLSEEADASITINPNQYAFLKKNYNDKVDLWTKQSMGWLHIDLNLLNPILKNINVRKAIIYAIDRKQIAKTISPLIIPSISQSWLSPRHYAYYTPKNSYRYNPQKAKQLLKKEGWIRNKDGLLQKNNEILKLSLITDSKDSTRKRIALFIREYLKKIGIDLEIKSHTTSVIFSKLLPYKQFDMALYAWHMNQSIDGELYWASYKIPEGNNIGLNFASFRNNEIDKIHKELHLTVSREKRKELLAKHQEIWKSNLPAIPLFIPHSISATKKGVKNWKITGSSVPLSWNCEEWEL